MSEIIREICYGLKKPRSGWVIRGISEQVSETVFEHTKKVFRATRLYSLFHPLLDANKMGKMSLYHDIAEYREKDYTPDEISKQEKFEREKSVIEDLVRRFPGKFDEVYVLWLEFEEGRTPEAIAVRQLDIMDAGVQALSYYEQGISEDVSDFFPWVDKKLFDPFLRRIWDILLYREFPGNINYQYVALLEVGGNRELFRERMIQEGLGNAGNYI